MPVDKKEIQEKTRWQISDYESKVSYLLRVQEDKEKEQRLLAQKCECCYYSKGGLAMQAFKTVQCRGCDIDMTFPTSIVNRLCKDCGEKNDACVHCMGSLNLMREIEKRNLKNKVSTLK